MTLDSSTLRIISSQIQRSLVDADVSIEKLERVSAMQAKKLFDQKSVDLTLFEARNRFFSNLESTDINKFLFCSSLDDSLILDSLQAYEQPRDCWREELATLIETDKEADLFKEFLNLKTEKTEEDSKVPESLPKKSPFVTAKELAPKNQARKKSPEEEQIEKECGAYLQPCKRKKEPEVVDEKLRNIDKKLIESIENEIISNSKAVTFDDIAGLKNAKQSILELIIWPMQRPDLFNGIRGPPKGLLLFGPPGTGKTLIGKCIASMANATFFSISSSSLTSKWIGEGEKMVRALFAVARVKQPSVIFIDEIDSLLTSRSDNDVESSRRIKTEFLVQFDGCGTSDEDKILIIGATNRPQEIDEAARRRLSKRLYIPLPDKLARRHIVQKLVKDLTEQELDVISEMTENYSGADMENLVKEAAIYPLRELSASSDIRTVSVDALRRIELRDFSNALAVVKPSVSLKGLKDYEQWNLEYGSSG